MKGKMMADLICEMCGSAEPYAIYNPNTAGHPTKRKILCQSCGQKDGNATIIEKLKKEETMPTKTVESKEVKDEKKEEAPPLVERSPEPDEGSKSHAEIFEKIKVHEEALQKLAESREKLIGQLRQTDEQLLIRKGAVASLREVVGT